MAITKEENDLLTQTGPGTPCGAFLRRYWQPVALSEEMPPGGSPSPVRILGEDLVLFRDDQGRLGLLDRYCSHRGADLSYGRVEADGLRCIYHGWLYDGKGRCLDQPAEAGGGIHRDSISHVAYACREAAGMIFAYLGPGEPSLFPNYEFLNALPDHLHVRKIFHECSYLQGNEGNLDMTHGFFLHYPNPGRKGTAIADYMMTFRGGGRGAISEIYTISAEVTDFGVRLCRSCPMDGDKNNLRLWCFVLPDLTCFPGSLNAKEGYQVSWHVPINDVSHWKYMLFFNREKPIDSEWIEWNKQAVGFSLTPDHRPVANKTNRYKQDRESMRTTSYSGVPGVLTQDMCAIEGQPIQDRTKENLVPSDLPILLARKQILRAIKDVQEGKDPPHVIRNPAKNSFPGILIWDGVVSSSMDWKELCGQLEAEAGG